MLQDIGMAFVVACHQISEILVQRNEDRSALYELSSLPQGLPHELVQVSITNFLRKARHRATLSDTFYNSQKIDAVTDQHKELLRAYCNKGVLRAALDGCEGDSSFEASRGLLDTIFADLCEFYGGIATTFSGTFTVEADFSVLRWEKNGLHKCLSEFRLEGVMLTNQYTKLEELEDTN